MKSKHHTLNWLWHLNPASWYFDPEVWKPEAFNSSWQVCTHHVKRLCMVTNNSVCLSFCNHAHMQGAARMVVYVCVVCVRQSLSILETLSLHPSPSRRLSQKHEHLPCIIIGVLVSNRGASARYQSISSGKIGLGNGNSDRGTTIVGSG